MLHFIKEQDSYSFIDKIYLYAIDLNEPKYNFSIKKRENAGIKHWDDPSTFIEQSITMDDVYEDTNNYNPGRKWKLFMIWLQLLWQVKKFEAIIKQLFIRCRILNISIVFITQFLGS